MIKARITKGSALLAKGKVARAGDVVELTEDEFQTLDKSPATDVERVLEKSTAQPGPPPAPPGVETPDPGGDAKETATAGAVEAKAKAKAKAPAKAKSGSKPKAKKGAKRKK